MMANHVEISKNNKILCVYYSNYYFED